MLTAIRRTRVRKRRRKVYLYARIASKAFVQKRYVELSKRNVFSYIVVGSISFV